ncbi:MAG TPA: hypothetical protein EYN71_11235, partial [Flavobacteriales bacterium]|nr:hypothetical protein [Flavobacteriales bacterium]
VSIVTPPLLGATISGADATCNAVCDGFAAVSASGGTTPYTYNWDDPLFQTTDTANGLCAGTFTVTVTDAGNCDTILTYVVNEPLAITLSTSSTPATCGNPDGSACVTPSGGTTPYTYLWNDPGAQTDSCAITLLAGGYTVQVTDSNGCVASSPVSVSDVGSPTASITDSADVSCSAGSDGSATVTGAGGTPLYTYSWDTSPVQTNAIATGLPTGTYTATLTDANGCVTSTSVTIGEPLLLTVSITANSNVTCATACDGTATASVSGGTTPYTYSWDSSPIQTNAGATALCAGFYTISVTDSAGCTATDTITLTEPLLIAASILGADVSCNLGTDGSADLTVSGGTMPYTYAWSHGPTSEDVSNLGAGPYTVTVTDVNGCNTTASINISQPLAITLSTIEVDANCGQDDGTSTVSATGGTGAYTYSWNTSPIQTNAMATGLFPGTYTATVTDSNGCFETISATIADIPGGSASAVVDNNTSGFNICDGQATASMTGGTAPYTYLWDDPAAQTTATAAGLCDGTFCVTVTDANGCPDSVCITITEPAAVILTIIGTDVLCSGNCTGAADLTVTGGIPPYTYLWNPGGMTAEDIINLCAGTYTVDVTDSNGVVSTDSVTITEPASPLTASVAGTDILCNGQTTGAIDLSVSGGTAPYTYSWTPGGETTEDLSNLGPGLNTVTVTDTNGCTATTSYTVIEPIAISLTSSGIDANCGQSDGQASVSASGGVSPFTYSWNTSPVQTGNTATAIPAGTYTVVVTDASGCQDSTTVNISDLGGGTGTITTDNDASCFGTCDGQASISLVGGSTPFTYAWDDPSTQTTATATGLCVGTYNVSVTDAVGCLVTGMATIAEPGAIILGVSGIDATCFGICDGSATTTVSGGTTPYTYAWNTSPVQVTSNATGLCAGNYSVTVTDANACDTIETVAINEPLEIVVTTTTITSTCGQANGSATASVTNGTTPYTYIWSNAPPSTSVAATGLLAGSYTLTVTDVNGCTGIGTAAVSDTTGPLASIIDSADVSCPGGNDGSLEVFVNDGSPPYTYSWNDPLSQTTTIATGLVEGTYVVTIIDVTGCTTTASSTIMAAPLLVASVSTSTDPSCNTVCDGSATVTISGGTAPYTILWDDPGTQTTATAIGLCDGSYTGTVTDANGCTDTATVTLTEPLTLNVTTSMFPASCSGVCDGSIATSVAGGIAPYTYAWDDPSSQTTGTASSLCAGGFNVTVTDANGCTSIISETVTEPAPLVSTVISIVGVSCNGVCDGYAEISVAGGTAPLTYLWSNGQTTALAINLCGGALTVDITDAGGCTISDAVVIPEPAAMVNAFTSINVDCFGNANGVATANITGGTAPYTYLWDDLNLQTTASATGLIGGSFTVLVTDSSGCTLSESITITEPPAIAMTLDTTGANCGFSDGSACVTVSAGVAPFTYLWDDPSNQTTACVVAISSGTYNVTVTDATGCNATGLVVVNDLGAPTLMISSFADANCSGGCDGFATVQILNGDPPYVYLWNDPGAQTTANAAGLCAGTYIVNILDSNNCSGSISATIGEPTLLSGVISAQTPTSCAGSCDGTAAALGSGGTPPYSYQWNDPSLQTTQTAVGLCAGTYGLTIIDGNGCTDTTSVTIAEPLIITLTTSTVAANCGQSDGSATVSASGGNGLYGYLWDDVGSQNTATALNIPAGTYTVIVTDILGCTASATVTVSDQPAGTASIPISVDVSCNGGNDGNATVSMAGGTLPFTYLWDDPLSQTTSTATGLGVGLVTVSVTDSVGCLVTASTTINEPTSVVVNASGVDVSCKQGCDGSATAIATGGTGGYSYQWDDPLAQTNVTAFALCAGQFIVTATDMNGCTDTASILLGAPDSIVLSETHSDANCGQADGIATVTVTGGTGPYTYLWNPGGQTTPFVTNLSAGTYFVTVTDANLCSESLPVTISDLNGPSVSISSTVDVNCNGGTDGQANAVVTGGLPGYSYLWNDPMSQITPSAANLAAGIYTITVVDANGCIASTTATINEPAPIVFNPASTNPTCFGDCNGTVGVTATGGMPPYQYVWNDPGAQTNATAIGLCAGTYIGSITDSNNCTVIATIAISDPQPITSSISFVDETCFGGCDGSLTVNANNGTGAYTYIWDDPFTQATQTAGSLCVGTYNVTITDNNGCLATASGTVSGPIDLNILISSSGNNPCFGNCQGFAQTTVTGGSAPFTYLWSDGQISAQAVNLCAGIFDVTVTDGNGCTAQTNVTITEPQGMALNVTGNNISCNGACDGTATASVSGGVTPYTYLW